jgi:hypothetical protein
MRWPKLISKRTLKPYVAALSRLSGMGIEYLTSSIFEEAMDNAEDESWLDLALARDRISSLTRDEFGSMDANHADSIQSASNQSIIVSKSILHSIVQVIRVGSCFDQGFNYRSALLGAVILKEASLAVQEENLSLALLRWRTISEVLKDMSTESAVLAAVAGAIIELENSGDPEFATFLIIETLNASTRFERQFLQAIEAAEAFSSMGEGWIL